MRLPPRARVLAILIVAAILRTAWLDAVPPGFNYDHVYEGYDAYSVLLTGKDSHGVTYPLLFRSWGDYKPALTVYSVVPFVMATGLGENAVRLAGVMYGMLGIASAYAFVAVVWGTWPADVVALFLALSPMHIHLSRSSPDAIVVPFLLTTMLYHLYLVKRKSRHLVYAAVPAALLFYAYAVGKVVAPFLVATVLWPYRRRIARSRALAPAVIVFTLLVLPSFLFQVSEPGAAEARFWQVSVFGPQARDNLVRTYPGLSGLPGHLLSVAGAARNYLHYTLSGPLFRQVDSDAMGIPPFHRALLPVHALLALAGIWATVRVRRRSPEAALLIVWLLLAPLPASLTDQVTSHQRLIVVLPLVHILAARGLALARKDRSIIAILCLGIVLSAAVEMHSYLIEYPCEEVSLYNWRAGLGEAITTAVSSARTDELVVLTRNVHEGPVHAAFYTALDPSDYQTRGFEGSGLDVQGPVGTGPAVIVATLMDQEKKDEPDLRILAPGEQGTREDILSVVPNVLFGRDVSSVTTVKRCGEDRYFIYRSR